MGIVLSGGTIVTAADHYQADVRIEGETIAAVGKDVRQPGDEILQVAGCLLFPGGIDPHTHFDLPVGDMVTADDFASGTKAAILGGTTTIIDYVTQFRGQTLAAALANWQAKATGKCYTDYGFHMGLAEWNDGIASEMDELIKKQGITSFKLYMAYKDKFQLDDAALLQVLRQSKASNALVCVHCENGDMIDMLIKKARAQGDFEPYYHPQTRPVITEAEAVARLVALAQIERAPIYIVHVSCREALDVICNAKRQGIEVYAETCPQYLLLDESYYQEPGFDAAKYVLSPPLRPRFHQKDLWIGLKIGAVDTVATDHCSFNLNGQKDLGIDDFSKIPNGIPGVETRMGLLYTYGVMTGKISINQFVNLTSTTAAKLFGLFPRKGTIAPGSDADIVVWNPKMTTFISAQDLHQRVDYTPYEGFRQIGKATQVFLRGRQVVYDGSLQEENPGGIYLSRKPFLARKVVEACSQ